MTRSSGERRASFADVQLEPVPRLEWSLATESHPAPSDGTSLNPSVLRRGWVHTASEEQVLALYRKLSGAAGALPAPWWLRSLERGQISSRDAAFEFEDQVHAVLSARDGWVFVPWAVFGEIGYWEYAPSDREPMKVPTTVMCTDEHLGWLHVVPAHREDEPLPIPLDQVNGLVAVLPRIESW